MSNCLDPYQDEILSVLIWIESVEILTAFLKETFEKVNFAENQQTKKSLQKSLQKKACV